MSRRNSPHSSTSSSSAPQQLSSTSNSSSSFWDRLMSTPRMQSYKSRLDRSEIGGAFIVILVILAAAISAHVLLLERVSFRALQPSQESQAQAAMDEVATRVMVNASEVILSWDQIREADLKYDPLMVGSITVRNFLHIIYVVLPVLILINLYLVREVSPGYLQDLPTIAERDRRLKLKRDLERLMRMKSNNNGTASSSNGVYTSGGSSILSHTNVMVQRKEVQPVDGDPHSSAGSSRVRLHHTSVMDGSAESSEVSSGSAAMGDRRNSISSGTRGEEELLLSMRPPPPPGNPPSVPAPNQQRTITFHERASEGLEESKQQQALQRQTGEEGELDVLIHSVLPQSTAPSGTKISDSSLLELQPVPVSQLPPAPTTTAAGSTAVRDPLWCQQCDSARPPRAGHCSGCHTCVLVFDHHCGVIGACVGYHNYRFFFLFLFFASIALMLALALNIVWLFQIPFYAPEAWSNWEVYLAFASLAGFAIVAGLPTGCCIANCVLIMQNLTMREKTGKQQMTGSCSLYNLCVRPWTDIFCVPLIWRDNYVTPNDSNTREIKKRSVVPYNRNLTEEEIRDLEEESKKKEQSSFLNSLPLNLRQFAMALSADQQV